MMSKFRVYLDMLYKRLLSATLTETKKSVLLLGPRQTGKSTLIRSLSPDLTINLAAEQTFLDYSSQPDLIVKVLQEAKPKTVFIDEVQRIPSLLNTLQSIIDESPRPHRFYLTGSSARKLRRGNANLLPGRIISHQLGPLLAQEFPEDLSLKEALTYGTLPGILAEQDREEKKQILRTYSATYLKEEIQAEALTKQIEGFARFLFVAASKSGEFLDFTKLGTLAAINQKTSSRFFEILEDTLIVHRLNAYASHETQRLVRHPKYYFFDNGVLNGLLKNFTVSEDRKGGLFEHFIVNQVIGTNLTYGEKGRLTTYRTEAGAEVDLLIERDGKMIALEIKSAAKIATKDLAGLGNFVTSTPRAKPRSILLYTGERAYREKGVEILPWRQALGEVHSFLR